MKPVSAELIEASSSSSSPATLATGRALTFRLRVSEVLPPRRGSVSAQGSGSLADANSETLSSAELSSLSSFRVVPKAAGRIPISETLYFFAENSLPVLLA